MEFFMVAMLVFIFGITVLPIATKMIRRSIVIKKCYRSLGNDIKNGKKDDAIIDMCKSDNTAAGIALTLSNQASDKALGIIKSKGLARAEERDSIWISGAFARATCANEGEMLTKLVSNRFKIIGIKQFD